jgi:hypothetical protein
VSDLQCPVRVHLVDPGPGERVAAVVDLPGASAEAAIAELGDLSDLHRGEAVTVRLDEEVRREVAERLTGRPDAVLLEGDADGWVAR